MSSLAFHPANFTDDVSSKHSDKVKYKKNSEQFRQRLSFLLQIIIVFLIFVIVFQLVFHIYLAPKLKITSIEIQTSRSFSLSDAEVLAAIGLSENTYYFATNVETIQNQLEQIPLIYKADVVKSFPNKLKISLFERTALAYAFVEIAGFHRIATFDKEGVLYSLVSNVPNVELPVISGISFTEVKEGLLLPEPIRLFLVQLDSIKNQSSLLYGLISEIKFIKKMNGGIETLLFFNNYPVKVRLGDSINQELLKSIVIVLDLVKREGIMSRLQELDFRTQEVVYKLREDQN